MNFYRSISEYYDLLFPVDEKTVKSILSLLSRRQEKKRLIDIGCATGQLSIKLSGHGLDVSGIDYDEEMIRLANNNKNEKNNPIFYNLQMEDIYKFFDEGAFHYALCLGNTLANLPDMDSINFFIEGVYKILKKKGQFIVQIINYDYILNNKITSLPVIENDLIKFNRLYELDELNNRINFRTELIDKNKERIIENEISLYPLIRKDLTDCMKYNGFKNIRLFGSLEKGIYKADSIQVVVRGKK